MQQTTSEVEQDYLYAELASLVVPGRECGTCTLCCKLIAVEELNKPRSHNCVHCIPNGGCGIHLTRPRSCRGFICNWLLIDSLGSEWKPHESGFVLQPVGYSDGTQCLVINVDPERSDCWRTPPFIDQIRKWAAKAAEQETGGIHYVLVIIHEQRIVVLPDREIDLGIFGADDQIAAERKVTPKGTHFTFRKVDRRATGIDFKFF